MPPPAATPGTNMPAAEETIVLSPFTVRTDKDTGYAAANTLAAQRLLLPADVQAYISAAQQPVNVVNNPVYGSYTW